MEVVCSWKTLFHLAGQCGQAKMAWMLDPSDINEMVYREALKAHGDYRDACLAADRMVHFPGGAA